MDDTLVYAIQEGGEDEVGNSGQLQFIQAQHAFTFLILETTRKA